MFTEEELAAIGQFFNIQKNIENTLLHMDSKGTSNQWLLLDFGEKFEDCYAIYFKGSEHKVYKYFNEVKAITNVLNLISSFEGKKK